MNKFHLFCCAYFFCNFALAESSPRQECLGRAIFEVPEAVEWAVFPSESVPRLSDAGGGGAGFTGNIGGRGEVVTYDLDGVAIYVSGKTTREQFDKVARYIHRQTDGARKYLEKQAEVTNSRLTDLLENGYSQDDVAGVKEQLRKIEQDISEAKAYEHDLGISDAWVLGDKDMPFYLTLWRNQRVYFFSFSSPTPSTFDHIKDLASRFRTRELYEVPKEPGICFPYGFIADDGKTAYRVKNSLRFSRTPNVIFSLIVASADDPSKLNPTNGLYDTDVRPGYDGKRWQKTSLVDGLYFGKHLAAFTGWRLDPKPGSGEQERAWFGYAYTGGPLSSRPLMGVHVFTFEKGVDDLTEHTPPPEDVLPRLKALTSSMSVR